MKFLYQLYLTRNNYILDTASLYFVRSGLTNINIGHIGNAGIDGSNWSTSTTSNVWGDAGLGAYYLALNVSTIYPSYGPTGRWPSRPLRT